MKFPSRLKKIRKEKGLTQRQFAEVMNVKQKTISNWESGRNEPNIDAFNIIRTKWAVNINWLLGEDGSMFEDSVYINNNSKYVQNIQNDLKLEKLAIVQIPQYDISLSAGSGAYPAEHALSVGARPFDKQWLVKKSLEITQLSLVRVMGDSMEPLLKDKDIVMIDASRTKPTEGMPFAIRLDGDLLVKNIQRTGDGFWSLVSRNKAYNDIIINPKKPPDDFAIIGAVVWHAHSWI